MDRRNFIRHSIVANAAAPPLANHTLKTETSGQHERQLSSLFILITDF